MLEPESPTLLIPNLLMTRFPVIFIANSQPWWSKLLGRMIQSPRQQNRRPHGFLDLPEMTAAHGYDCRILYEVKSWNRALREFPELTNSHIILFKAKLEELNLSPKAVSKTSNEDAQEPSIDSASAMYSARSAIDRVGRSRLGTQPLGRSQTVMEDAAAPQTLKLTDPRAFLQHLHYLAEFDYLES